MSLMYAQMGMAIIGAVDQMGQASADYKMQKMSRAYNDSMSAISLAQSLNVMTENEISTRDAFVRASETLQLQSMSDKADTTVGAAAAGVQGTAVSGAIRGLQRGKAQAREALRMKIGQQSRSDLNQRRGLLTSAVYNRDVSVISRPSTASALLGLGMSMINIYDSNQPTGQRSTDRLAARTPKPAPLNLRGK